MLRVLLLLGVYGLRYLTQAREGKRRRCCDLSDSVFSSLQNEADRIRDQERATPRSLFSWRRNAYEELVRKGPRK